MKIQSLKLVCFSPTGTSKAVIQGIANGINHTYAEIIDITKPTDRKKPLQTSDEDLLLIAVPVYMGRVPALLNEWFQNLKANNTPTVCVVVYGNRAYENALLELNDLVSERGCIPIAGAAYIGEHSFHSKELPAASIGRPNADDLKHASIFGQQIMKKLQAKKSVNQLASINIPGNYPYEGATKLWDVDFIKINDACTHCGICAENCPSGAIDALDSNKIDIEKCTLCCACIKNCPESAKSMKPGLMKDAAVRVHELFREKKEPEIFLN
ncbi:MAG: ferredoxin [Marinilabiliales bacterium]|nr:MAG: ferredoxin [Marinilabiliales bacterium]